MGKPQVVTRQKATGAGQKKIVAVRRCYICAQMLQRIIILFCRIIL